MVANRTREIRLYGMKTGACWNVSERNIGLRHICKGVTPIPKTARTAILSRLMSFYLTAGNVDDRKPMEILFNGLKGITCELVH